MFFQFHFTLDIESLGNWLPTYRRIIACSFQFSVTTFLYTFCFLFFSRPLSFGGGRRVVHQKILWSTRWKKKRGMGKGGGRGKKKNKSEKGKSKEEKEFKYWMNVYINMNIHIHVLLIFGCLCFFFSSSTLLFSVECQRLSFQWNFTHTRFVSWYEANSWDGCCERIRELDGIRREPCWDYRVTLKVFDEERSRNRSLNLLLVSLAEF